MQGDIHVLPLRDLKPHEETRWCWCEPRVEQEEATREQLAGPAVVIHHSADGRELIEEHGVQ